MDERSFMAPGARLILASTSPSRASILRAAGLEFEQIGSGVDEVALRARLALDGVTGPQAVAEALARAKALAVSAAHRDAFVIGGDQVLNMDGAVWDKPGGLAAARAQLEAMRGARVTLHSAVCVARSGVALWEAAPAAHVRFRAFSETFQESYLSAVSPDAFDCVGACQVEGFGAQLLDAVEGDLFTVMGLPLLPLLGFLRRAGVVRE
ncbi:MAG: nucleoside triphosphate pyrophosphatase [Hyphomicrobiales bacterium]|nr:nucleoside triphosphate pyrophosphatase [Hyphomicrobiales bacterium]